MCVNIEPAIGQLPVENGLHRFVDQRARRRIPYAALGRMPPQLQKNKIRLERRIRSQVGPPVTVGVLQTYEIIHRAPLRPSATGGQTLGDLYAWAHTLVAVCNCTVRA